MSTKQPKSVPFLAVSIVAAIVLAWWFGAMSPKEQTALEIASSTTEVVGQSVDQSALTGDRTNSEQSAELSMFVVRLADAESMADPTCRKLRQAEIYAEWLEQDFHAAFEHLAIEGFDELFSLPGLARIIADRAEVADWVTIADRATRLDSVLPAVGRFLSATKLVEFAAATRHIDPSRVGVVAGVMGGLLGAQNLDSALHYAGDLSESEGAANAYAGIVDQLAGNHSPEQAREIVGALPDSIRSQDAVLFAYGNAMRDLDPPEAIATLSAIADPQYKKLALVAFSRKVEASSPAAAIQAVVLGLGTDRSEGHVSRILKTWSAHDATAARAYIDAEAWVSEAQRDRFIAVVEDNTLDASVP